MIRALPLTQCLDIGRQLDNLLADHLWVRRVVAWHNQQRCLALAHEFAVDAEDEVPAEHVVAKAVQDALLDLGALFADALAQVCTKLVNTSRFSAWPIGFCSTAAVIRLGAISHKVRQNEAPMQPPMTWNRSRPG